MVTGARTSNATADDHGRFVQSPGKFPRPGWKDILFRVKDEATKDNIGLVSAGVAFYFLLAIFPMITAFLSIYGLMFDPKEAQSQLESFASVMPSDAHALLSQQASQLTKGASTTLGFSAVFSILLALWSARKGASAMTIALNIVYDETDNRSFIKQLVLSFTLTLGLVIFFIVALGLVAIAPVVLQMLGLGAIAETLFSLLRWPLLGLVAIIALGMMYRICPDRAPPQWRWLMPGSVVAVVLWLITSILFSWYVSSFGNYNETYGSIGAVIILLFWFYLTAYIFLMGAELNAEMEHQTRKDTTTGPVRPMGERDAYVADDLGKEH